MAPRNPSPDLDLKPLLDVLSDPSAPAGMQAAARTSLYAATGPSAEAILRLCAQASAARRELASERERLANGVRLRGIVTAVLDRHIRVLVAGSERELLRPDAVTVGVGQTVFTDGDARTIVGVGDFVLGGQAYVFVEALDARHALVQSLRDGTADGARQLALVADGVGIEGLVRDDHVLGWSLEGGNVVLVTRRLERPRPAVDEGNAGTRVIRRDELIGLDEILKRVERLFLDGGPAYADVLACVNGACVGVVLSGAPGVGKSMLAEYVAGCVRARGGRALYRTASHYLSKWVGEGAAALRADFAVLDLAFAESGVRPLLVIDELEAIALDRHHASALHAGFLDVLDTLLSLLSRSSTRMIGISNVATRLLDAALVRDGRLPIVPFPAALTPLAVEKLVATVLDGLPLAAEAVAA